MKKIMFNDKYGLTEAVLTGRKTMTRRIIPIDLYNQTDWKAVAEGDFEAVVDGEGYYHDIRNCGKYRVGEEVAVAQSYKRIYDAMEESDGNCKANEWWCELCDLRIGDGLGPAVTPGFNNKMFVRADLMPHRIRITDLWFEHLQDISDEDCLREGVERWLDGYIVSGLMERSGRNNWVFDTPREAFAALIDRINGRGTWHSNPWVVAYEFELIKKED